MVTNKTSILTPDPSFPRLIPPTHYRSASGLKPPSKYLRGLILESQTSKLNSLSSMEAPASSVSRSIDSSTQFISTQPSDNTHNHASVSTSGISAPKLSVLSMAFVTSRFSHDKHFSISGKLLLSPLSRFSVNVSIYSLN